MAITIFFSSTTVAFSAEEKVQEFKRQPNIFEILLPGGPHFQRGDTKDGLIFAGSELSLLAMGYSVNNRLEKDYHEEWNVPWLLTQQIYIVDKWSWFQKEMIDLEAKDPGGYRMKIDKTPLKKLVTAPFDPDNLKSPFVLFFAALGALGGISLDRENHSRFGHISEVRAAGHKMNKEAGTLYYSAAVGSVSLGAAVSEEMMFRGFFLPYFDYRHGQRKGLFIQSVGFGLIHLANPNVSDPGGYFAFTAAAGYLFGKNVQENDYRLSEAIAAHFWYDFILMLSYWAADPKNNPIGIGVGFEF